MYFLFISNFMHFVFEGQILYSDYIRAIGVSFILQGAPNL